MDELPRLSRTHRKAAIQVALWRPDTRIGFLPVREADFRCARRGGRGLPRAPGPPENAFGTRGGGSCTEYLLRTREGGFRYRISLLYQKSLFFTPSVLENAPRTTEACFAHRAHIPYHRRPSPVPNATNTTQSHPAAQTTASSMPSLRPSDSWKPSPHESRLGQETTFCRKTSATFSKN